MVAGGKEMSVLFGLKWFHQDSVVVNMEIQYDVVVAAVGAHWELAFVISVDLVDELHLD